MCFWHQIGKFHQEAGSINLKGMIVRNFEFKARVADASAYEEKLQTLSAQFIGEDFQTDTYFKVAQGRLKLREGSIEQALIHYLRPDINGAKLSNVLLYKAPADDTLRAILTRSLGVLVVVEKRRRIYFLGNVKFHFDEVNSLGQFIEVEVIDELNQLCTDELQAQCLYYARFFELTPDDFVSKSYSDLLLEKQVAGASRVAE